MRAWQVRGPGPGQHAWCLRKREGAGRGHGVGCGGGGEGERGGRGVSGLVDWGAPTFGVDLVEISA